MTHETAPDHGQPARPERRRRNVPFWHPKRLRGRRMRNRRADDEARPYLVDRIPGPAFALAALLLILSLVDGLFTLALMEYGYGEANPAMVVLLEHSAGAFLVGKYLLTAVFLPVALVTYQYRLFGTRVRVKHVLPVVAALYAGLVVLEIHLWHESRTLARLMEPAPRVLAGGHQS